MPPEQKGSLASLPAGTADGDSSSEDAPLLRREAPERLDLMSRAAYGVGHVLNDVCASMWFSYTLLFLHAVIGMPGAQAGAILMLGQVVDALATPLVGIAADRTIAGPFRKYGRRKFCHLVGELNVLNSFNRFFVSHICFYFVWVLLGLFFPGFFCIFFLWILVTLTPKKSNQILFSAFFQMRMGSRAQKSNVKRAQAFLENHFCCKFY